MAAPVLLPALAGCFTTMDIDEARLRVDAGFFGAVVDVRRADEWAAGHLENATFCPSLHETRDTAALAACRSCPIAVYCMSGLVSHREGS